MTAETSDRLPNPERPTAYDDFAGTLAAALEWAEAQTAMPLDQRAGRFAARLAHAVWFATHAGVPVRWSAPPAPADHTARYARHVLELAESFNRLVAEAERRVGLAEAEREIVAHPDIHAPFVQLLERALSYPKANWERFKTALLTAAEGMWPAPSAADLPAFNPSVDELSYWRTPAWQGIVDLLRRCEFIPEDEVAAEAVRLSQSEPTRDQMDHRLVFELRQCATNAVLSRQRAGWSHGWLHALCRRYLDNLDGIEGLLLRTPEGTAVVSGRGIGFDRVKDFTAFWDIARTVAGMRPFPPRPVRAAGLNIHEVRAEVERLMNWCAGEVVAVGPKPPTDEPPKASALPEPGVPPALSSGTGDLEKKLAKLPKRARVAYLQYRRAADRLIDPTDRTAYDELAEDEQMEELPTFETWAKYLREARYALGEQKKKPRPAPRPEDVRSAVPIDDLD